MPQITEMAFVAVPRQLFAAAVEELHSEAQFDEDGPLIRKIPSNIYSSQICPSLTPSQWKQYESDRRNCLAMHLSQTDLRFKNSFQTEWPAVQLFLRNLKKPACIVAHNGANFDFRVLYAELVRNKLLESYPMPEGIFFLDSYLALLDIERLHLDNLSVTTSSIDWEKRRITGFSRNMINQTRLVNGMLDLAKQSSNSTVLEEAADTKTEEEVNADNVVTDTLDILQDLEPQPSDSSCFRGRIDGMRTPPSSKRRAPDDGANAGSGSKRLVQKSR